jgi:hypothetical protein
MKVSVWVSGLDSLLISRKLSYVWVGYASKSWISSLIDFVFFRLQRAFRFLFFESVSRMNRFAGLQGFVPNHFIGKHVVLGFTKSL